MSSNWFIHGFVAVMALLAVAVASSLAADDDTGKFGQIRACMQEFVDQQDTAGVVMVVGRKQGVIYHDAVGCFELTRKEPMPKDAIFRIASMTKPITALGVMILIEEGKAAIDDPVENYLPEFRGQMLVAARAADTVILKKSSRAVTVRDLLTHTSGLPSKMPQGLADLYEKRNHTLAEGVMAYSQRPLEFEPGSKWAYCNPGIDTAARIIEVVSGQPYEEFLRKRIFEPLGMKDSWFFPTKEQMARVPPMYNKIGGKLVTEENPVKGPPPGARWPRPSGGLFSTGADLARLYQLMLNNGSLGPVHLLKPETVALMTRVHTGDLETGFSKGIGWGLGWSVVRQPKGITEMLMPGAYGHGGGYGTQAWLDPKQDLFMIMLIQRSNQSNVEETKMRHDFQAAVVAATKK